MIIFAAGRHSSTYVLVAHRLLTAAHSSSNKPSSRHISHSILHHRTNTSHKDATALAHAGYALDRRTLQATYALQVVRLRPCASDKSSTDILSHQWERWPTALH